MTAREDALESRPVERSKIEQMMLKGGVSREISLAPLDSGERALLIGELLGLEGELASQVEDRCGGNPLFAVQLIGDWVERGVLEVADAGFKLRANEKAVVPDNIHQLMTARIERLLKDKPPVARTALELAATLGQDYEDEEWLAVCALAGFVPPASLVEDLLSGSLIKKTPRGWLFRHGMLRESIARQALESGRSKNHNFLCAQMLVDRNENFSRRAAMRLGLHCYAAGRLPMAGRYFFKAAVLHLEAGEYSQSLEALAQSEAARKELAVPESDAELGRHMLLRADVWKRQGRLDDSKSLSAQVEVLARRHGWENLLPLALQNTGDVARIQGDMLEAQQTYQVALGLFEGGDNQAGQAQVLSCLADICCQTGDLASSKQRYGQVLELYRALGVEVGIGQTMCGLGQVALQRGALQDALRSFRGALRIFEEHGRQPQIIDCLKNLADVARFQGRFDDAMIRYRKVLAFYENIGSGEAVHTRLAIGLLKLQQGDHTGARVILEACRKVFETTNERDDLGRTHAQLIPCAAAARDWEACLHHHDRACVYLRETRRYDLDIAWSAQLGGELAKARGMTSLAIKAFRLAHQQWKISGQKERAADVAKTINALEKAGSL
jgi:tetratricopeptide (TPR) repeat protein